MVMLKRLMITGSTLRIGSLEEKEKIKNDLKKNIWHLIKKMFLICGLGNPG